MKQSRFTVTLRLAVPLLLMALCMSCGTSTDPGEWKFAYMSDNKWGAHTSATQYTNIEAVGLMAGDMAGQDVSLVLVGGDLIDGRGEGVSGLTAQYREWIRAMQPVYAAGIGVYAVPGNHEYWCDVAGSCVAAWQQAVVPTFPAGRTDNPELAGREYSFVHRNVLFLGLDQNRFGPSFPDYYRGNSIPWIQQQLAARNISAQPHVFVFGHMPQFMTRWGWTRPEDLENREAFWGLLAEARGRLYFTGHSHAYAVGLASTQDGRHSIYQVIAGSGGAEAETTPWSGEYFEQSRIQPADWDENLYRIGYALVTVRGRDVSMVWRNYDPATGTFTSREVLSYRQP